MDQNTAPRATAIDARLCLMLLCYARGAAVAGRRRRWRDGGGGGSGVPERRRSEKTERERGEGGRLQVTWCQHVDNRWFSLFHQ